jgi:arylsulfatase A-like enzyme
MKRFALASLLALLFACGSEEASPPNVLLVTVDTLRPDRLSAYGFAGHETPHIDALAAAGALFENAFTDAPWTTPAMASVMTGAYPTFHGFRSTNANRLGLEHETLAERLRERGYATAAIIGSFPLDSIYQLDQGFDVYDDEFTLPIWKYPGLEPEALESEFKETPEDQAIFALVKAVNNSRRTDAQVTDAAIAWLDGATPDAPFFLWVHFFGPHSKPDWTLPEEKRFRAQFGQYDPDVVLVDREIGRLLERHHADSPDPALPAPGRRGRPGRRDGPQYRHSSDDPRRRRRADPRHGPWRVAAAPRATRRRSRRRSGGAGAGRLHGDLLHGPSRLRAAGANA